VRPSSRAGAIARTNVVTCSVDETVGELDPRWDDEPLAVMLHGDVVIGVVKAEVRGLPASTPLLEVLQPEPPTVRPSITARELARSMDKDGEWWVLVSTSDGKLIGLICRDDLDGQH
jgi:CBS domain-containing protein